MTKSPKKLKELLDTYNQELKECKEIERGVDAGSHTEKMEDLADKKLWDTYMSCADEIAYITGLPAKTCREMLLTKLDFINGLFAKMED
jgi:hypothetical protein